MCVLSYSPLVVLGRSGSKVKQVCDSSQSGTKTLENPWRCPIITIWTAKDSKTCDYDLLGFSESRKKQKSDFLSFL